MPRAENRRRRSRRAGGAFRWAVLAVVAAALVLPFTPAGRRVYRAVRGMIAELRRDPGVRTETKIVERVVEKRVEVPVERAPDAPPALPEAPVTGSVTDIRTLASGLQLKSHFRSEQGRNAAVERVDKESYGIEFTIHVKVPTPARTLDELKALNPALPEILPALPDLLRNAKVSGFYHHLYDLKQKSIRDSIMRLDRVLTRHNFYDLETVLELEHPATKARAILIQAEMDVVSDGSDGDRMTNFDDYIFKSQHFQPTTSYGWAKLTSKVNPLVPRLEEKLAEAKAKLKSANLSRSEKSALEQTVSSVPKVIADLKKRSYLIAQEDPFIVIPLSLRKFRGSNAWTPGIGDYAVVIAGDKVMPAIVGDYGPSNKVGEASLRIAREIDPKSGPYNRPISDLTVSYLIFPGSADPPAQPDYAAWHRRCSELLGKLGGLGPGRTLHVWTDRLKPPQVLVDRESDSPEDGTASESAGAGNGSVPVSVPPVTPTPSGAGEASGARPSVSSPNP